MGSGQRAYRQALGQLQASDEAYLRELQAGEESFADIFDLQTTAIADLSEQLNSREQGGVVVLPGEAAKPLGERNWLLVVIIGALSMGVLWRFFK